MKRVKIKRLNLKQLFLGIAALSILPLAGLSIMMILATPTSPGMVTYGIGFVLLGPILYGAIGALFGAGYNWISPKIGQFELEVEVNEIDE